MGCCQEEVSQNRWRMKLIALLVLAVFVVGIVIAWSIDHVPTPLPDSPTVAKLRTVAHERGLKWKIVCFDRGVGKQYMAWMVYADQPFKTSIEGGATKPQWVETYLSSSDAAAQWLLDNIDTPNKVPTHEDGLTICETLKGD